MINQRFNSLRACFVNCSLKADADESHTRKLLERAAGVMASEGVETEIIHARHHNIAFGMAKDLSDCGWLGEIGPGPSYGDEIDGSDVPAGYDSEFTNKNTTFMAWNLMHMAKLLNDAGGIPAVGNIGDTWQTVSNAADQTPA